MKISGTRFANQWPRPSGAQRFSIAPPRSRRAQPAFTLLELVVAITVTVMVSGAAVAIVSNITRVRGEVRRQMAMRQEAHAAVHSLAVALRNLYRTADGKCIAFEGKNDWLGDFPADAIRFFSISRRQVRPGQPESDVHEFEFRIIAGHEEEPPALVRRTDPTRNEDPDGGGVLERMAEDVVGMNLSYHDGVDWRDEWEGDYAPQAVRIDLFLASSDERDRITISRLVSFPHRPNPRRDPH